MVIQIKNLWFSYDEQSVLKNINVTIPEKKKTALIGLNGSGKTTLLNHMNGLQIPQLGQVNILGLDLNKDNQRKIFERVGYLFDFPDHQLFSTTVYKDIKFGLDNYGYSEARADERIHEVASVLDIVHLLDAAPFHLSLGQKKRVALAGLLVLKPEIIVMDEPFSGLDNKVSDDLLAFIDTWVDQGHTAIFSCHDIDLVYAWADEVIVMEEEGNLLAQGPVSEVLTQPSLYTKTKIRKPYLYELFEDSSDKPRSIVEAKKYIL